MDGEGGRAVKSLRRIKSCSAAAWPLGRVRVAPVRLGRAQARILIRIAGAGKKPQRVYGPDAAQLVALGLIVNAGKAAAAEQKKIEAKYWKAICAAVQRRDLTRLRDASFGLLIASRDAEGKDCYVLTHDGRILVAGLPVRGLPTAGKGR